MKSRHPLSVSDLPSHRVLAGLLACGLAASGPLSADVIADFNVIGARTINTAPGLIPS